ncbi:hypothetical protein [Paraburkholderia lacunae]|uniref:hypothetical protein n=1 Tax=Paraburkholderia lacunae TaxID=2211104 RepID=UPI0010586C8B|nr:hypothetical protein [Paraburkholderia lacunae]
MKARTIALAIALLCANPTANAQSTDNRIYAPNELILGMTYGDWSAAWWQFYLQIPSQNHPFSPNTSDTACHNGTQPAAPVYFLAGVFSTTQIIRNCTVPAGSPILFPVTNAEWSNLEIANKPNEAVLNNPSGADLRAALCNNPFPCPPAFSKKALPKSSTLNVTLDGVSINFLDQFHFESPVFSFEPPVPVSKFVFYSNINSPPGGTPISVSDGYWIAIKPLPVGQHTLIFSAPGISNLYYLNVQ